jgi:hypothetical protein
MAIIVWTGEQPPEGTKLYTAPQPNPDALKAHSEPVVSAKDIEDKFNSMQFPVIVEHPGSCRKFGITEVYRCSLAEAAFILGYRAVTPQPNPDAQDATRYRWLAECDLDLMRAKYWPDGEVPTGEELDAAIDHAMQKGGA